MNKTALLLLACLGLGAGSLPAEEADAPLAVTTLASPSPRVPASLEQQEGSDRFLNRGLELLKEGQAEKAVQAFNDSVRLAPGADNFKALGTAYYQSGDSLKAAWAYRESLRLRPDPKVQALADSLAGKGASEDAPGPEAGLKRDRLIGEARGEAAQGRRDLALKDYLDACAIRQGGDCASPALSLAAEGVEEALSKGAVSKALELLVQAGPLRLEKGLDAEGSAALSRLDKGQQRALWLSGMGMADNEKAMLADHDAWARAVDGRAADAAAKQDTER